MMRAEAGDIAEMKKAHPCGSREWRILRVGADFRLKCMGCGHQIMVSRRQAEKMIKNLVGKETAGGQEPGGEGDS